MIGKRVSKPVGKLSANCRQTVGNGVGKKSSRRQRQLNSGTNAVVRALTRHGVTTNACGRVIPLWQRSMTALLDPHERGCWVVAGHHVQDGQNKTNMDLTHGFWPMDRALDRGQAKDSNVQ